MLEVLPVLAGFFVVSALYGAVGHGGASGYLAWMALLSFAPESLRPTALVLNLAVSLLGTVAFYRAGHFRPALFWPFALAAIPFAWLGGTLHLPPAAFKLLLALTLSWAALRLVLPAPDAAEIRPAPLKLSLPLGALMGLVSGLVGVGGGIFLTPLLILGRWANAKTAAAVSAPFILVNSAAGLAGQSDSLSHLPDFWPALVVSVVLGGALGARWGSIQARPAQLRPALALVLLVAVAKLTFA